MICKYNDVRWGAGNDVMNDIDLMKPFCALDDDERDFFVPCGLRVCLPSICRLCEQSARRLKIIAVSTYRAGGHAIEALLALDGDSSAVWRLQLDIKSGYDNGSVFIRVMEGAAMRAVA